MSSDAAISIQHLSKIYNLGLSGRTRSVAEIVAGRARHPIRGAGYKREKFFALDDLSFDVARGEAVGVIGKNGAGKSTLLKILSRITPPTRGSVEIVGTVGSLLEVGTGFHPELTGIENVYLNGAILGMSSREIDRRLDEIVEFAEVDAFLATPVKRYSSGMRVRLAFAVAAHLDPEVLIIDEVLSVGDFAFQAKCLRKMKSVATDEGRTVLYVTHNLVTLENLCPRTIFLASGKIMHDGRTADSLAMYLNTFPRGEKGNQPGVFDLSVHDRPPECAEELFKRLSIRPRRGSPSDVLRMGEPLQIDLDVEGLSAVPGANVYVSFGSMTTQCVFRMTCRMRPMLAAGQRSLRERVVIDIPALPLTPGEYHIDVGVFDKRVNLVDDVRRAATFSVSPADVLGNGYQFTHRDGHVTIPWEWEIRPSHEEVGSS